MTSRVFTTKETLDSYKFGKSYTISFFRFKHEQSPRWQGWKVCVNQKHKLALTTAGPAIYAAGQKQRIIYLRKPNQLTWRQVSFPLRLHVHGKDRNSSLLRFHVINMDCYPYQQYYPPAYSNIVIGFWIVKLRTHRPTFWWTRSTRGKRTWDLLVLLYITWQRWLTHGKLESSHSVQFSRSVVSDCLWPHGLQHTSLPCPSPTPGAYSNSYPLSQWCHPTISSSVIPFSCLQSFPASGSFQMSQFFASGGQSIGVSASASVLSMNSEDWFPLGWIGWISLQSKGLSRVFSNTTVQKHQFFGTQLS